MTCWEKEKEHNLSAKKEKISYKERTGDALALRGEEGRDKLRKAVGRRK